MSPVGPPVGWALPDRGFYAWGIKGAAELTDENALAEDRSRTLALAWFFVAIALIVFATLCAMVWHATGPMAWENGFISETRHHSPPGAYGWRRMFEPAPFALLTFAIAAAALFVRKPKLAISGAVGCLLATVAAEHVFKPLVDRSQPFRPWTWSPVVHPDFLMFPSGHVAAAAACATFAWFVLGRTRLALLVFVVPIFEAWAMLSLGHHFPADVVAGFILGVLAVCATVVGAPRAFRRSNATKDARRAVPSPPGSS